MGAPTTIAEGDQAPNETFPFFANITSNAQGDLAAIVTYATLDSSAMNLTAPFMLKFFYKKQGASWTGPFDYLSRNDDLFYLPDIAYNPRVIWLLCGLTSIFQ